MAKLGETTFGTEILSKAEIERGFVGKSASLVADVSRLADGCSADDIRDMVNKLAAILCSMHGKTLSLLLALAASVLTMPAVADAGLSVVSNRLGSVGLNQYVVTSVAQAPRRYALFVVPLNDYRSDASASPWNGFELKASTNNFSEAVDQAHRITFWCPSHGSSTGAFTSDDADFFLVGDDQTSGQSRDNRAWVRCDNTLNVGLYRRTPNFIAVLVSPEKCRRETDTSWLREDNDDLIWSYMRVNDEAHESHTDGKSLWNPIMPVRWYSSRPSWAN